ncbi:hypothetical protein C7U80_19475 [Escherichia coli]|nr:hypothetical protein C7U80_19475 [Escherichia coli]
MTVHDTIPKRKRLIGQFHLIYVKTRFGGFLLLVHRVRSVSYTNLTLPTTYSVTIPVDAGPIKKKPRSGS